MRQVELENERKLEEETCKSNGTAIASLSKMSKKRRLKIEKIRANASLDEA